MTVTASNDYHIHTCARGEANKVVAAAAHASRMAAPPPARQSPRSSVAIDPTEILHQSGVFMVREPMGPLTAAEAQIFDGIVGGLGTSDGGFGCLGCQCRCMTT